MDKTDVRIKRISKYHYRIIDKDGIGYGTVTDRVVEYLEFRSEYTAKAYIQKDGRLSLIE